MKQPRTFLLLGVVVATLLLGVAYAAINNINFNISGTVTATPDQEGFKVDFSYISYDGGFNNYPKVIVNMEDNYTAKVLMENISTDLQLKFMIQNNSSYPVFVRPINDVYEKSIWEGAEEGHIRYSISFEQWDGDVEHDTQRLLGTIDDPGYDGVPGNERWVYMVVDFEVWQNYPYVDTHEFEISFEASPYESFYGNF